MARLPMIRVKETKSILSSSCRFCLPILHCSGKRETQKERLPVRILDLLVFKSSAFRSLVWNGYLFVSQHILWNDKSNGPSARLISDNEGTLLEQT